MTRLRWRRAPPARAALAASLLGAAGCAAAGAPRAPSTAPAVPEAWAPPMYAQPQPLEPLLYAPTDVDPRRAVRSDAAASLGVAPPAPLDTSSESDASGSRRRYLALPDVSLSPPIERTVSRLADAYFRRTGKRLVATSGARDAERQAAAMCAVLRLGGDVERLYRSKAAVRELKQTYDAAHATATSEDDVVARVAEVIRRQMDRGVFVSAHLRAGAVDVRNRDMSASERRAFRESVVELGGIDLLEETTPPHFHLDMTTALPPTDREIVGQVVSE